MPDYMIINGELYHHGVKGMKWGRRRWQNADGSLTPAGQKRYNSAGDVKSAKAAYKTANKELNKAYREADHKRIAAFSPVKKHRDANTKRWETVSDRAKDFDDARTAVKDAKFKVKVDRDRATASAVKDYSKKFNSAERAQNTADSKWEATQAQYKSLGKTKLGRIVNAAKGNTPEAKKYKAMYDEWEKSQDFADRKWDEMSAAYKKTGRNRVSRILNNIKYDR